MTTRSPSASFSGSNLSFLPLSSCWPKTHLMEFSVTERYSKRGLPWIKKVPRQKKRIKKIGLNLLESTLHSQSRASFYSFSSSSRAWKWDRKREWAVRWTCWYTTQESSSFFPFLLLGMSTPSTSHLCPDFLSLPARNLAPDYSYSRLIHNQGCNLLIKEWNSLLPSENSIALLWPSSMTWGCF